MADSVYLETSVISALFDLRADPVCQVQHMQTQEWHDEESANYELFTSAIVIEELRAGEYDHQLEAVTYSEGLKLLPVDDEVVGVARIYVDRLVVPRNKIGDALHLAVASVHGADYLLTWNCRHLANPARIQRATEVNRRLGLITPVIITPSMLYREDRS